MIYSALIVDDDETCHVLYKAVLAGLPIEIETAFSGEEGYTKLVKGNYHLVLLDMIMPNGGGIDFLRAADLNGFTLPTVLVCSSIEDQKNVMRALMLGATSYLIKPIKAADLQKVVSEYLFLPEHSSEFSDDTVPLVIPPSPQGISPFTIEAIKATDQNKLQTHSAQKPSSRIINTAIIDGTAETLAQAMSAMVINRATGKITIYTAVGIGRLNYEMGRLQEVEYGNQRSLQALESIQVTAAMKITVDLIKKV
jgi:response regulator of citrate/malate metabolism